MSQSLVVQNLSPDLFSSIPQKPTLYCKIQSLTYPILHFLKKIFTLFFSPFLISLPLTQRIEKALDLSDGLQKELNSFLYSLNFQKEKEQFEKDFHRSAHTEFRWNGEKIDKTDFLDLCIALSSGDKKLMTLLYFSLAQGFPNEVFRQLFLELNTLELAQSSQSHSRLLSLEAKEDRVLIKAILTPFILRENEQTKKLITLAANIAIDKKTKEFRVEAFAFFSPPSTLLRASDPIFLTRFTLT